MQHKRSYCVKMTQSTLTSTHSRVTISCVRFSRTRQVISRSVCFLSPALVPSCSRLPVCVVCCVFVWCCAVLYSCRRAALSVIGHPRVKVCHMNKCTHTSALVKDNFISSKLVKQNSPGLFSSHVMMHHFSTYTQCMLHTDSDLSLLGNYYTTASDHRCNVYHL